MSIIVNPLALGWKHNNAQGIVCRQNAQGQIELIEWPAGLGAFPTQIQADQWATEYAAVKPTVLTYGAFTARFDATEMDNATKHIFAADVALGTPLRPRLQQAIMRAAANDQVDLLSPTTISVMDALVAAGVITLERRNTILTP